LTELLTRVDVPAGPEDRLKNFPAVVRMWAKLPEFPAQKRVWLASAATDRQTGKLVSLLSPAVMLGGALREGLRNLLDQPASPTPVRLKTIPPAQS
jgi:hypothetical protein